MSDPYRRFETGATRDLDDDKLDVEGFESPLVRLRFAKYMHGKRRLADGTLRASDNWQQGIPADAYVKSLTRHALDVALHHDGYGDLAVESIEASLCAVIFNASGLLFEILKEQRARVVPNPGTSVPKVSTPTNLRECLEFP